MTAEPRLILDLTDVLALRLECQRCGTAVVFKPIDWREMPFECPGCKNTWELPQVGQGVFTPLGYFGLGLRRLLEQAEKKPAGSTNVTTTSMPQLPYRVKIE